LGYRIFYHSAEQHRPAPENIGAADAMLVTAMPRKLDPQTRRALADRVGYYRELGIHEFYRRPATASSDDLPTPADPQVDAVIALTAPDLYAPLLPEKQTHDPAEALRIIREEIGPNCTRCKLGRLGRKQVVFGVGNPRAELMFVGEGPGADEDEQGEPFVGRAGQLLNKMIEAMGLKRSDVYIANVVKCRPPQNRTPERDECETCSPFLLRQIEVIRPKAIVALGAVAAKNLLQVNESMGALRSRCYDFRGARLFVTYHPAYLLRDPRQKTETWKDLQQVMKFLGLKMPAKS
jgi:uracil-DNA glycosylase family 4